MDELLVKDIIKRYENILGRKLRIPLEEIKNNMSLDLDEEEAVKLWLEDEEIILNEEQEKLNQKAKESRITATIHEAKVDKERKKIVKENPTKEMIIQEISKVLPAFAHNIIIENKSKIITFSIGDENYKIDLIQKRKEK